MAIAYADSGSGVNTVTTSADLNPACPATVNANDILIAHVSWKGTTDGPTTPSGWTFLYGPCQVGITAAARHWIFGKLASGSEDSTAISFGTAGGTTHRYGIIHRFTGWSSGTLDQLVRGFHNISHDTDPQGPGISTLVAGGLAVAAMTQSDDNNEEALVGMTGGTWVQRSEYLPALGTGAALFLDTCAPSSDPGTVFGGAIVATNDPSGTIGFAILPSPAAGPLLVGFESVPASGNPKTVLVPNCETGDKLYAIAAGNASSTNTVTGTAISTTSGSTDSWVEEQEQLSSSTGVWCGAYSTTATGSGDVTVSLDRTQTGTQRPWMYHVWRVRAATTSGAVFVPKHTNDATEVVNTTVTADSAVVAAFADWDALTAGALTPTTQFIEHERSIQETAYTHVSADWLLQAAGTRDYGTTGSASTHIRGELIKILPGAASPTTATGTGVANDASVKVSPVPTTATGSGTANNPTVAAGTNAAAGLASGTGTVLFDAGGGSISVTLYQDNPVEGFGVAFDATPTTASVRNAPATLASGTGTANQPAPRIDLSTSTGTGTGTANNATVTTSAGTNAPAGLASGTGTANQPIPSVAPIPTAAAGAGTANNPNITTSGGANVNAGTATATGTANDPGPSIRVSVTTGAGSGTANNATVTRTKLASAGVATGTGTGNDPHGTIATTPTTATATGTAFDSGVPPQISRGIMVNRRRPVAQTSHRTKATASMSGG